MGNCIAAFLASAVEFVEAFTLILLASVWGSYVVGAICGSALELHMALLVLVFPLCVLAVLIVLDVFRPLQAD